MELSTEERFQELKDLLLARSYQPGLVDATINRARTIPRAQALKRVDRLSQLRRPVNVVTFDPRLPSIQKIHQKYWKGMTEKNPYLENVFPEPPLVAFRRQTNIKDYLIRSKVPKPIYRKRQKGNEKMWQAVSCLPLCKGGEICKFKEIHMDNQQCC